MAAYIEKSVKLKAGRPTIDYQLSADMAKELCMVEKTAIGRQFRQYFIAKEKELRAKRMYGQRNTLTEVRRVAKPLKLNGRLLYPYRKVQQLLGFSTKSSLGNVRRCYAEQLVVLGSTSYISEEYLQLMIARATTRERATAAKAATPVLPAGFGSVQLLFPNSKL